MNNDMKCPFCGKELKNINFMWFCENESCRAYDWIMEEAAWQELIRTRKALGIANEKLKHCVNITVEELDELKGNLLIAQDALLHFSKDPIANNALKKITTPKQKD